MAKPNEMDVIPSLRGAGTGPAILLSHGYARQPHVDGQIAALQDRHKIMLWDWWTGESDYPHRSLRLLRGVRVADMAAISTHDGC